MPGELLIGLFISLVNVALQALASVALITAMRRLAHGRSLKRRYVILQIGMVLTGTMLTATHLVQVGVWAIAYDLLGAVKDGRDAYYLAFVNFTTLGYGDILPTPEWRLLGPVTAANGMLMFGWSTAILFAVLTRITDMLGFLKDPVSKHAPAKPAPPPAHESSPH
ncbi:MAG: hypothetical protein B7Y12_20870 [Rhizobiales bacterium 24-66-13]|jgi:hypothetical protein|nr:MAG: hypothetical protein B7Y12_20870 [Rhizobiales bacterium 24-66-13]HQS08892.1 potassium channel family protein [Xanthobacteraceae bacterium]